MYSMHISIIILRSGKGPSSTSDSPPKRRKRERNNYENSKSLANGTHSKSSSPTDPETDSHHCNHGNDILHSNDDCSGNINVSSHGNTRPKRRKVAHSRYSITIEDDPVIIEHTCSARVQIESEFSMYITWL